MELPVSLNEVNCAFVAVCVSCGADSIYGVTNGLRIFQFLFYMLEAFWAMVKPFKPLLFRAAFKFGRRVHFALRRKMLKPPIVHLPAI